MITLKLSPDEFDVKKALLVRKYADYFDGKFERETDQYDSIYYNNRLMEFKFVQVDGAKSVRKGNYVLVTLESPDDGVDDNPEDMLYIIRFNNLTKPEDYGGGNSARDLDLYLRTESSTSFKRAEYNEWLQKNQLKLIEPVAAPEPVLGPF